MSSLRIESDRGRRLAVAKRLHPYQQDLIDEFIRVCVHITVITILYKTLITFQATPLAREVSLFVNQQEIINKLDAIVTNSRTFAVSDALMVSHDLCIIMGACEYLMFVRCSIGKYQGICLCRAAFQ